MRIAWFRATRPDARAATDETAPIIAALQRAHRIDVVTAAEAHDFVWRHERTPYDVCVYELGSTPAHQFMQAYLAHYPGVIAPRGLGVGVVLGSDPGDGRGSGLIERQERAPTPFRQSALTPLQVHSTRQEVTQRAVARAVAAGAHVGIAADLSHADVVAALDWPPTRAIPLAALQAMAARKAVIVLEVEGTAGLPAYDPQTWQPRGFGAQTPVVISIDPRDEEHSLMLALKRLAADPAFRAAVAAAGFAWWRAHATLEHAVTEWDAMLATAAAASGQIVQVAPAYGSASARAILAEFGVTVDVLQS